MESCLQRRTVALWDLRAVSSLLQYTVLSSRGQWRGMKRLLCMEHCNIDPVSTIKQETTELCVRGVSAYPFLIRKQTVFHLIDDQKNHRKYNPLFAIFFCLISSFRSVRPSGPHMKKTERPESAPPSRQPFAGSPFPNTPGEHLTKSEGCTGPVGRRRGEERCSFSSLSPSVSPIHWPNSTLRPWPSSLTSQSEHGSDQGGCRFDISNEKQVKRNIQ